MMKSCLQQLDSVSLRTLCLSKLHEKLIACMYTYIYINALFGLWILGIALQSHMISMLTHSDGEIHTYMHYLAFTMALFGHHNLLSSYKTIFNYNRYGILRSTQIGN